MTHCKVQLKDDSLLMRFNLLGNDLQFGIYNLKLIETQKHRT